MPPSLFSLEYHVAELHRIDADRRTDGHAAQVRRSGGRRGAVQVPSLHDLVTRVQVFGSNDRLATH